MTSRPDHPEGPNATGTLNKTTDSGFWHPALLYRTPEEYLAGTVPFVADGVAEQEPVAVAVPGPQLELLRAALHRELGAAADRVTMLDMSRAGRNPGRIIPGVLRDFADRHTGEHGTGAERVRIIGEPIWRGRSEDEYPACAQHEALINFAFTGRPVSILCPYNAAELEPYVLADAARTHPVMIGPGGEDGEDEGDGGRGEEWLSEDYAPDAVIAAYNQPLPAPRDADEMRFTAESLESIRTTAVRHATAAGLSEERVLDVELAIYELATNSIVHGGGSGALRTWQDDRHVVFETSDRGHITDPLAGRRPVAVLAQNGGRGLLLVHQIADLVRVHTGESGTTVRVYFAR